jgi:PAS domain S-box-containing protein
MVASKPEERVLIFAPTGSDAAAMASLLDKHGFQTQICNGPAECCEQITEGAGALLLTEEALALNVSQLLAALKAQPPWSELPLIILTSGGESRMARLLDLAASAAGSVTLLERPMSAMTLWRSVEAGLLSRRRQYQVRDLLEEQARKRRELEEAEQSLRRAGEAKAKLAAIVEFSEDAIISKDLNGIITSWNRGAEDLFGYKAQEAIGQPITMLIPPDRLHEEPGILERARRGEPIQHYETVRRRKDGMLLDISLTISPVRDEQGQITGVSKIARDITAWKQAEQALVQSEARYRTLVSQIKDYAIFRTDRAGVARTWNEGVKRVLGFDEGEFVGLDTAPAIFTPEDFEAGVPQRELQTAAAHGTANNDRWMRRKDGTRFYASGVTTVLKDETGQVIGFTKVLRDDTEKRQAEEKLERTVAERTADLRETNEQLEAFVYSIAHDLRAPLRSMGGFSQLLLDDHAANLNQTGQQLLKRIHAASEFMDKLLVDLLAYGRTARAELELSPVDVHRAWDIALLQCAAQIEQSKACVETAQPLPTVRAHETTLGQILANLLNNALKFVAPGVQPRVIFRAEQEASFVRLWLEDNGIGISTEQHERIFRVFERLHGSRYSGTGIGLSIVRKGVERMGGAVGLVSAPGNGTRFWIELPKAN